ncbi:MAG: NAD(P)/FAD-dependent oxidoreductase [Flavitalea sp.]
MLLRNQKVVIIGGGPGGLTLARLLQLNGVDVSVYERDLSREVRVQGATLDLHEGSGLEALKRAGLINEFYQRYRPGAGKLRLADKHGVIHLDDHAAEDVSEDRPEIDRGPLRELLIDSLLPDTIVWNSHFTEMKPDHKGWLISFKNGNTVYADLVIGCDGANSKLRPYLTNIKPVYSGITIVEGNLYNSAINSPGLHELVKGGKVFVFGDDQSLILSSKGDGSISFYTGCKVPENWVTNSGIDFSKHDEVLSWFKAAFKGWNPLFEDLFGSKESFFIPRPQYHFPLDQQWAPSNNLVIIGDAAHLMPPYAGEGVNMAMQDAFELAELFASDFTDLRAAIAAFDLKMFRRASEITEVSLNSTKMLHSGDPINNMLDMVQGGQAAEQPL